MKMHVQLVRVFLSPLTMAVLLSVCLSANAQEHKAVNLSGGKGLPFSDAVVAGNTLYVAGQEGTDATGKLAAGGIAAETKLRLPSNRHP